jgi:hypothetical protein
MRQQPDTRDSGELEATGIKSACASPTRHFMATLQFSRFRSEADIQ